MNLHRLSTTKTRIIHISRWLSYPLAILLVSQIGTQAFAASKSTTSKPSSCQAGITVNSQGAPQFARCSTSVVLGITEPPSPADTSDGLPGAGTASLQNFAVEAGRPAAVAADYQQWGGSPGFIAAQARADAEAGAVEEISWEPFDYTGGLTQPAYTDRSIASGAYDSYLKSWAAGAKAYKKPLFVRFAAEMNGNWDSWDVGVNGNTAADYVAMWRHVYAVVTGAGAKNITWLWSPNVSYAGSPSLASVYPGSAYVGVVALDGYNWGSAYSYTSWQSFGQIFNPDLASLAKVAPGKPIWIAETASTEQGGSKAAWIADAFKQVDSNPNIVGLAWFDFNQPPTYWPINSSAASLQAFDGAVK